MGRTKRALLRWLACLLNDKQKRILCLTTLYLKLAEGDQKRFQSNGTFLFRRANILLNLVHNEDGAMVFASKFKDNIWPDAIRKISGDASRKVFYLSNSVPFWLNYGSSDQIYLDIMRIVRDLSHPNMRNLLSL